MFHKYICTNFRRTFGISHASATPTIRPCGVTPFNTRHSLLCSPDSSTIQKTSPPSWANSEPSPPKSSSRSPPTSHHSRSTFYHSPAGISIPSLGRSNLVNPTPTIFGYSANTATLAATTASAPNACASFNSTTSPSNTPVQK